jgi:hypothetical protein
MLGLLLARAAVGAERTPETVSQLHAAVHGSLERARLGSHDAAVDDRLGRGDPGRHRLPRRTGRCSRRRHAACTVPMPGPTRVRRWRWRPPVARSRCSGVTEACGASRRPVRPCPIRRVRRCRRARRSSCPMTPWWCSGRADACPSMTATGGCGPPPPCRRAPTEPRPPPMPWRRAGRGRVSTCSRPRGRRSPMTGAASSSTAIGTRRTRPARSCSMGGASPTACPGPPRVSPR